MFEFYRLALSSENFISRLYAQPGWLTRPDNIETVDDLLLTSRRTEYPHLPDHIYLQRLKTAFPEYSRSSGALSALLILSSVLSLSKRHLQFIHGCIYTRSDDDLFERWQELMGHLSPLPLLAGLVMQTHQDIDPAEEVLTRAVEHSTLPICLEPKLNNRRLKGDGGRALGDLHLHLNGSTEADFVWEKALAKPVDIYVALREKWRKAHVRRRYTQEDLHGPTCLYRLLFRARLLRQWLCCKLIRPKQFNLSPSGFQRILACNEMSWWPLAPHLGLIRPSAHPLAVMGGDRSHFTEVQWESLMLLHLLKTLKRGDFSLMPDVFHAYLILKAKFHRLLIHQRLQAGFDQFQTIADFGLRDAVEDAGYTQRFKQLEGMYGPWLGFLEGRFAPKNKPGKLKRLLRSVANDYRGVNKKGREENAAQAECPQFEFSLTAHFIKGKEETAEEPSCRFFRYRNNLRRQAIVFLNVCQNDPTIRNLVKGKDAAANEMDTPPEVFSPIFRQLNRAGLTHTTFHVGEDFRHPLSGLRAVDEALTFLDMKNGDRLGHCTALGLAPELWIQRIGHTLCSRREWLDNLIWAIGLLSAHPVHSDLPAVIIKWQMEAEKLFFQIHQRPHPPWFLLYQAWKQRGIDPLVFSFGLEAGLWPTDRHDLAEFEELHDLKQREPQVYEELKRYYLPMDEERRRENEIITLSPNSCDCEAIKRLQQIIICKMNNLNVAVEVMPTSNKCISIYDSYQEHHMLRWLRPARDEAAPSVVLGTDDPGIFATSIRNEYTHLLQALKKEGVTEPELDQILGSLINNAHNFRFK